LHFEIPRGLSGRELIDQGLLPNHVMPLRGGFSQGAPRIVRKARLLAGFTEEEIDRLIATARASAAY
jgi:hypothetical protein